MTERISIDALDKVKSAFDYDKIKRKAIVNYSDNVQKAEWCLWVEWFGYNYRLCTYKNFSALVGGEKSRKSFLMAMLLASSVGHKHPYFRSKSKGRVNHLFDTEQSRDDVYAFNNRVCEMADSLGQPTNFVTHALRPYGTEERYEYVKETIAREKKPGFIAIDGIRDLVKDVNNATEATDIINDLMRWTDEYDCHICNVLHFNPGSDKARGHLGTELMNKAETVLKVEFIDDQSSIISPRAMRGKRFSPNIGFRIEEVEGALFPKIDISIQDPNENEKAKF